MNTKKTKSSKTKSSEKKLDSPLFVTLVHSIAHSALVALGMEGKDDENKILAEFNIEMLILLREKTKGNLTKEEKDTLDHFIKDLQILFAKITAINK